LNHLERLASAFRGFFADPRRTLREKPLNAKVAKKYRNGHGAIRFFNDSMIR
jgi:hypothetical protein